MKGGDRQCIVSEGGCMHAVEIQVGIDNVVNGCYRKEGYECRRSLNHLEVHSGALPQQQHFH